jgi:MYXO-CTERM domain-containing protein
MIRIAFLGLLAALPAAAHDVAGAPHAHPHVDPNLLLAGAALLAVLAALAWQRR